jgi:hypothetical protein
VPFAVLSWRYLLPNQHPMVTLHKQAFLQALPRYSRPVWCLIALYGYTAWFLFFAWKHILVAFRREREYLYREHNVAPLKHLSALLKLTLLHTIPPSYYYRHQLFKSKEAAWLLHIFDFECANIHKQMSPNISCHSKTVISDKHVFATEMAANHIPIVASTQLIETSREDLYLSLLQNRPLFLKTRLFSA